MINSIIAYNIAELEKKRVLSEAKILHKSLVITDEQWNRARLEFMPNLFSPSIFIRLLLFIVSVIGMTTIMGPLYLAVGSNGDTSISGISLFLGVGLLVFTELVLIKSHRHFRSGVTEAGLFAGLGFVAFAILFQSSSSLGYPLIGLIFSLFATIRYLNRFALLLVFCFLSWFVCEMTMQAGGLVLSLLPLILLATWLGVYFLGVKMEAKLGNFVFDDHFIILKSLSLILGYLSVNYFVVRQLSEMLLGVEVPPGGDIPLAIIFYLFTILIPIGYIYWGIRKRSILFIRVGLLLVALAVFTFKYYFSLGHPVVSITIAGIILTAVALVLLNVLKAPRKGFTREKLIDDKWNSSKLNGFIASQTLGGNAVPSASDVSLGGGQFGGGGAGSGW